MSALLVLVAMFAAGPSLADELDRVSDGPAHDAIVRAVRARLGATADVVVEPVDLVLPTAMPIEDAVLEPGATFGGPVRVLLRSAVDRGGVAVLTPVARVAVRLDVTVDHWHTTHAVTRGTRLTDSDLRRVRHVLALGPVAMPPGDHDVIGAAALRDLPADACVTARAVLPQPAVKAGESVTAIVRMGAIEARATLTAIDAGRVGATVRVRHPETKRTLSATVVGRGEVEVQR